MSLMDELLKRAQENREKNEAKQNPFSSGEKINATKSWHDWKGAVNTTDLVTGQTTRVRNAIPQNGIRRDGLFTDMSQAAAGAIQRQGANYKSAGATLLLGAADLLNGKKEFQPKVGSWLWRLQEGAEADTGAANRLMEDSKYGHGKAYGLVMDLTSGAVDLASDALLTAATGGASIGGKLAITAGLGAMGARSFGGAAEEARQQGKSTGQQFLSGLKSASIEMLTEKIGGPFEKIYGGTALGRLTNGLADRLGQSAGMKFVLNRLGDFSGEAAEEMLSDVLNPLADKLMKLDNGEGWEQLWTKEGMSQMAYDGLVGGLLGLFGGAAEGISGKAKAALIGDSIDSAMAASQQGRSIGAELDADQNGIIASAISNQAPQEADSSEASQSPVEAQSASAQQVTPKAPQTAVKQGAGEFNAEPNVEQPKQKRVGKKTARDMAWGAWFNDNVRQDAGPEGVAVDSSDFANEVSTSEPENGKVEASKVTPTAAERLANYNNPQTTDAANRGLKGRVESAVRNALAQNGIDYSNDPRSDYYDENTGEYREEDVDLLDEEARAKYQADMRQIRLLDAVDEWLDRNGQRYLSAKKGSEAEIQQNLQNALNDYVRRYLDSQTDKTANSEAVEDVMQQRRQDGKLKSLAKENKQKAPSGYNTVQVGDNLFRVTGPGGITTTEVADNSADAVQKHIDGLTEENRKKSKERKAKEQELKKLRQEVQESQENPKQIEGSDGKLYEVTKELTRGENNYQYVVTELDEDGLPTDMEARIFRKNANSEEEAVQHAIEHPEYFNDGSVEGDDWGERSDNEAKGNQRAGREDVHIESPGDGRGEGSVSLGPRNYSGRDYSSERSGDFQPSSNYTEEDTGGLTPQKVNESFAQEAAKIEQFGEGAIPVYLSGWQGDFADFIQSFVDGDVAWFIPGSKRFAAAFYHGASDSIGFSTGSDKLTTKQGCLTFGAHELAHRWFLKKFGKNIGAESKKFNDAVLQTAGFDKAQSEALRYYVGKWYLIKAGIPSQIKTDLETWYPIISEMLSDDKEFSSEVEQEISSRLLSGEFVDFFGKHDIMSPAKFQAAQNAARETADKLGIQRKDVLSLFPTVAEIENDSYDRWNGIEKFLTNQGTSELSHEEPPQPKRSAPPLDLNETLSEMSRERDAKAKAKDADFEAKRVEDKQQTNAKEYAYNKKLEAEETAEAGETSPEDKAKSTFGKDYEKVQKSADDFDGIKTRFDDEAFQKSDKSQDKKTRNKLKKLREAFRKAATTGDVETLFSIYEDLQSDSNLSNFYNEEIQEDIDNWRKLSDTNLDSYNEGAAPYAAARTMQRMAHKFKLANEYQQTLSKMNETLRGSKNGVMRKIGKSEKLTSAVARALMRWQINPDTVFKMIDAFDKGNAGEGYKLAKELQEAHREKYRVLRESRAKFDKASDLKGYQDFAFGKQTVKDYSGREWDMRSALSVIKAIDTIRSTSGKKLGGTDGFGVMDSKGNVEFIDMKDVDAIKLYESLKSGLSDVAIKYGELATEAFNDVKEPLRAKYKQNNGVDIGMVGDEDARLGDKKGVEKAVYSPLSYVDKNGNVYQFDIAKQETYNNIPRFLRERSDAGGTYILIKPYTEVTGKYFEQVSNYLAYSTFNEKMRVLGKGSSYESGLGNTLADVFGKDMGNWYRSYVEDLGSYHNEDDVEGVNSLLRQGRQQLQQGALLFSVSVPMKQISSYWAASGILHPDSLIKNYRIKLLKPKNSSDAATMLASRAMGNLEQSAAEAAKDAKKWLGKLKYSSKFIELAANAINQMDYNTVSNLLSATEYDVLKYQFGGDKSVIGTDEYKTAVEEKFQDVVDRSQPNFDKQMRAEYGRTDNEVIRMLSMFRTQQTQNLNLLATAIGEYQAAKGTKNQAAATETLKQTIAGQAASAFSLSMLTILADMLLHRQKKYEDEEEDIDISKVLTRLGINAIEASSGTLWFGDAVAKWAIDRISGGSTKEFYGVNMGVISTVSDILENFETAIKSPTRSNIKKCAGNIATIMGIPLNNAYSMLNSAIMYAKDLTGDNEGDYDDILRYLDAQTKAAKKAEEKAAKEAAKAEANSGADMLADTAKQNSSQSELNSQEEQKPSSISGYLTKPYNALVEAGMSSQRSEEVIMSMDTDGNNSVKQSEMIAYYKAHPEDEAYVEAMWNSYGYKTSWESAKKKAG